jgi:hypothetical protein
MSVVPLIQNFHFTSIFKCCFDLMLCVLNLVWVFICMQKCLFCYTIHCMIIFFILHSMSFLNSEILFEILEFRTAEIAHWYSGGLRAGWSGVWVPARAWYFSLHHGAQTCSEVHPASYPMSTRASFPGGVKLITHLHLVPRSKNEWNYTSTSSIRLHGVVLS